MEDYPKAYWDKLYEHNRLGWDVGYVSTPLKAYFDQLQNKNLRILVPGAGNGWEVEYLYKNGFHHTFLLDFSEKAVERFRSRFPDFPSNQIFTEDFFKHTRTYDLIVEQTFFSSLPKSRRTDYARQVHHLLNPGGKLTGLLFNHEFHQDFPPFGGRPSEYKQLFSPFFEIEIFETAINSIKPRKGREIFLLLRKKTVI